MLTEIEVRKALKAYEPGLEPIPAHNIFRRAALRRRLRLAAATCGCTALAVLIAVVVTVTWPTGGAHRDGLVPAGPAVPRTLHEAERHTGIPQTKPLLHRDSGEGPHVPLHIGDLTAWITTPEGGSAVFYLDGAHVRLPDPIGGAQPGSLHMTLMTDHDRQERHAGAELGSIGGIVSTDRTLHFMVLQGPVARAFLSLDGHGADVRLIDLTRGYVLAVYHTPIKKTLKTGGIEWKPYQLWAFDGDGNLVVNYRYPNRWEPA